MADPEPIWPDYLSGPAEHYHALGVIAAMFNVLEYRFLGLFLLYQGYSDDTAWLFRRLKDNRLRMDILTRAVEARAETPEIKDAVLWFMEGFGICGDNRNVLMHSTTTTVTTDGIVDMLVFNKGKLKNPLTPNRFFMNLPALRRVANEMNAFSSFGYGIYQHVVGTYKGDEFSGPFPLQFGGPLPGKPAPPTELTPSEFPTLAGC